MSHPQPGGYRTYVTNLVQHLALIDQRNEYVVAVDRPISWNDQPRWELNVLSRRGSLGVIWREQVGIPRLASQRGVDLVHAASATAHLRGDRPLLVTLYDTIEFSDPLPSPRQTKRFAMRLYSRSIQSRAARRASHIVTISEYSRRRIAHFFSLPPDRITAIHLAPSPVFSPRDQRHARSQVVQRWFVADYVMGIASAAQRKNTVSLLAAYARLPKITRNTHPLVLVCTHPGVKSHVAELVVRAGLSHQVRLLENVNDSDLALLYNAASVFVFPSLEEGFGLPPLEAMACGVPVVASNTSSIPEVVGDAGILVPPLDVDAIMSAIQRVLADQELANELRIQGVARSATFSWHMVAQQTITVYEKIARS